MICTNKKNATIKELYSLKNIALNQDYKINEIDAVACFFFCISDGNNF